MSHENALGNEKARDELIHYISSHNWFRKQDLVVLRCLVWSKLFPRLGLLTGMMNSLIVNFRD